MKNTKNFILSLKLPFNLVRENRVVLKTGDAPKEGFPLRDENGKTAKERFESVIDENNRRLAEKDKPAGDKPDKNGAEIKSNDGKKDGKPEDSEKKEPEVKPEKEKELEKEKKNAGEETKDAMKTLKEEIDEGQKKFLDGLSKNLDASKIAKLRSEHGINSELWDVSSKSGLDKVKDDWAKLEIYKEGDQFFKNVFDQLEKLSDHAVIEKLSPEEKKAYLSPKENDSRIKDKALVSAITFFIAVKKLLSQQDNSEVEWDKMRQEKDQDKIAATGIKFVKDNVKKFHEAIKQKDWGTALVYVLGAYVAYKGAMEIWKRTPDLAKKGIYVAGFLYVANMFAKNAGWDPLKALNITSHADEVRGTPLANFYGLNIPEAQAMDGRVLLDIGQVSVADLNSLYLETNQSRIKSIDPNAIVPSPFGDKFRGMSPDILGKEGPLDSKQTEYQRVGREIYKIVKVANLAYDKYMRPKNGRLTLQEALNKDPVLKDVSLMQFAMSFEKYVNKPESRLTGGILGHSFEVASLKVKKRFEEVFGDQKMGVEVMRTPIAHGDYAAKAMDFPLVIREDGVNKRYMIFARGDYDRAGGNPDASTELLTDIPFEGKADDHAMKLKDAIIGRFSDVVDAFNKGAGKNGTSITLEKPTYTDGRFVSSLTIPAGEGSAKAETMAVTLKISQDGAVEIYDKDGKVVVRLEDVSNKEKLDGSIKIARLVRQPNFKALAPFYKAGKLTYKGTEADGSFTIVAGDLKKEIKLKLVSGRYEFANENDEKSLFSARQNYTFMRELAEYSVKENEKFKSARESFNKVLDNTPEDYLVHLFKSLPKWFTGATPYKWFKGVDSNDFTGSIAKNYTKAMIDAQAEFMVSNLVTSFATSDKTMSGLGEMLDKNEDVNEMVIKLRQVTMKLSNINVRNEKKGQQISAADFEKEILKDVEHISIKSETYALWYRQFSDYIFTKFGKDEFSKSHSEKSAKLLGVFASYTNWLDDTGLDTIKTTNDMYIKYATYANYVAEKIYLRVQEGSIGDDVPMRGAFWGIDSRTTFESIWDVRPKKPGEKQDAYDKYIEQRQQKMRRYETGLIVKEKDEHGKEKETWYEQVAETDSMPTSKDYISFDEWLKHKDDPRRVSMLFAQTRTPFKFIVNSSNKEDFEQLKSLLGDGKNIDSMVLPGTFKAFHSRMQKTLRQLRDGGYGTPTKKFDELIETTYNVRYSVDVKDMGGGSKEITISVNEDKQSALYGEFAKLEREFEKAGRSLTKSEQMKMINERIDEIVKDTILTDELVDMYFKKGTLVDNVKNLYRKFKKWLF